MKKSSSNFGKNVKANTLENLARHRLEDAWQILKSKLVRRKIVALYIAGYSVECALKYRICLGRRERFLDKNYYIHDLDKLAKTAGVFAMKSTDTKEKENLLDDIAKSWSVNLRYCSSDVNARIVKNFLKKAEELTKWLLEE
ncbi:MAG: hypothetical protein NUW37_10700 [Planctomycetes bacterium]|nr:hypothetical protein [Planctomycetota bacterium]